MVAPRLKSVGVKDLKNNLSAFLRELKAGVRILITDRSVVVAELAPPPVFPTTPDNSLLTRWVSEGKVRLPTKSKTNYAIATVEVPPGTIAKLIGEDRGE